jgi:hypothetical protein
VTTNAARQVAVYRSTWDGKPLLSHLELGRVLLDDVGPTLSKVPASGSLRN